MEYCREQGVVPNITVAEISDETADKLVKYCGACAISRYENKDICYDSVEKIYPYGDVLSAKKIPIPVTFVCKSCGDKVRGCPVCKWVGRIVVPVYMKKIQ